MRGGWPISTPELQFQPGDEGFFQVFRTDQPRLRSLQHLPPRFHETEKRPRRPVIVEIPADMWNEDVPEPLNYTPVLRTRYGADPVHVKEAAALLMAARRPVIYAGQGVHIRQGVAAAEAARRRLAIPVTSSLGGKSSFPETHPLSLGSGGLAMPRAVPKFLGEADVIFGIGCSFTETSFGIAMPKGKTIIHSTLDPAHLNKDVEARIGLVGDAGLVLDALLEEIGKSVTSDRDSSAVAAEIAASHEEWLAKWMPKLTHNDAPLNPYRVLWDCSTPSTSRMPSSPMMPAARATSCRRSGSRSSRCPISAGARPPSSVTGSDSPWAQSSPNRTNSASTSGAMPRSVLRA